MKRAGEIVVVQYPFTSQDETKVRPAVLLGRLPGKYDDWLICMISSRFRQQITGFDEVIDSGDADFAQSGLKASSVIRTGRLLSWREDCCLEPLDLSAPNDCSACAASWLPGCCSHNPHLKWCAIEKPSFLTWDSVQSQ